MRLEGRVAIVLGGANGMGLACARRFADQGARVVLGDVEAEAGEAAAAGIRSAGGAAIFRACDASRQSEVNALVDAAAEAFGDPDIALHAAGIIQPTPFFDLTESMLDRVLAINLKGALFLFQAAARRMVARGGGGSLISISSVGGVLATQNTHAYGMSKAGLIHLAKSLAVSLAPYGIRANTVGPGGVRTRMQDRLSDEDRRGSLARTPLGRMAEPEEIANVVLFLASDESSYVTGQTIYADGGRLVLHRTMSQPAQS